MCAERYQQPGESHAENDSSSNDVEMTTKTHDKETRKFDNESPAVVNSNDADDQTKPVATGMVPFAIAKLYRLPLVSRPSFSAKKGKGNSSRSEQNRNISATPLLSPDSTEEEATPAAGNNETADEESSQYVIPDEEYSPAQLRTIVEAVFPKNGAKIVKQPRRALPGDKQDRYGIIGSDGTLKRILFVEKNGKVFEELSDDDDSEYEGRFSNTIKLGLGDFIFYSVLVAKSAQYSFTCFVSSFLVVLAGLGGTLVLLAVYKHALPALPISIFLAVNFYVFTRFIIQPWIEAVMLTPFYV
jgi:hypothetical protein